MTAPRAHLPIALTMGEPAGIGGEITLKTWSRRGEGLPPFFLVDDPSRLARLAGALGLKAPVAAVETPEEAQDAFARALPVLVHPLPVEVTPGRPHTRNVRAVLRSVERAAELALAGRACAVVTNPLHKGTLMAAGIDFAGHTEYLAGLAGLHAAPAMMLVCPGLRTVPVSRHLSLREAVDSLAHDTIVQQARTTAEALVRDFGIARPRLAVAALNPHGGEEGRFGQEEVEVIRPAVEELRRLGIDIAGPLPADALFRREARETYDAAICMYHDQALIPVKTLDFENGVNVTLGLPFVRTSPDHGTALSLAGTGRASEASLIAALKLAEELAARRGGRESRSVA